MKKRVVKLDEQHGIAAARIFMDEIGCLVSPSLSLQCARSAAMS